MAKKKRTVRKGISTRDVERWKRDLRLAQKRVDDSVVFLRGVDIELDRLETQKRSILANVPVMERVRDDAKRKVRYYESNISKYERISHARKRLAEEERKLKSMEALERERQFGRNIAK
ncbi:hypothetical protein LCGC14_0747900 [marine sediment metagenome]|uniref:Uncharacterized protein n=1 Tax=marine sediment metagenome TaxID=412755 RepID=A0A0F9TBX7_9ZZZZ